jgi:hypothetical protein
MSYTPSRGSTFDTETETARLLLCLGQRCSEKEGSQCGSTECHWWRVDGTQSEMQPPTTTSDISSQYQSSASIGSQWNATTENSAQQVERVPLGGLCDASIGTCLQTGTKMNHTYQVAAETIWNAVAGRPLDWDILTAHLGDMFGPEQRITRYVLKKADRDLLMTYLQKYRCALWQRVHDTCVTERTQTANAVKVWPRSPQPLRELSAAFTNIKDFHCWFSSPRKECTGKFGQCPFGPPDVPALSNNCLRRLEQIRRFLLSRGAEKMDTLWDLHTFEVVHFDQIAISQSPTGFNLKKAGTIQKFISCARVHNLAIHNRGKCPGMQLPEGYQACNNDRADLSKAMCGLTSKTSQEVQDILDAY